MHPLAQDPAFAALKRYVIDSTGLAYYADKETDLCSRISPRLEQLAIRGCAEYLALLLKSSEEPESERQLLIGLLTIGETYFFRHTEQFDALRDVVFPDLIQRNRDRRTLRIWSAGCATGAEPYTLAIMLKEDFTDRLAGWDVQILGTDINREFLARAARGEFTESALRTTSEVEKQAWFTRTGSTWRVRPEFRASTRFEYQNLVDGPYPPLGYAMQTIDLICCRNVMIYFDWEVIDRILARFHGCLADGGWLAVGYAESNPDVFRRYRAVNLPGATLYQKTGAAAHAAGYSSMPPGPRGLAPVAGLPWSPPELPAVPAAASTTVLPTQPAKSQDGIELVRDLARRGDCAEATTACERLLAQEPLSAAAHFYHALTLERAGDDAGAECALRRAIYLDRTLVIAHHRLALLLARTGRADAAMRASRNVGGLLLRLRADEPVPEGGGITAGELGRLMEMQLALPQS